MIKGLCRIMASGVFILLATLTAAEQPDSYFEDDTPARFTDPSELPPPPARSDESPPSLHIEQFEFLDFDTRETEGIDRPTLEQLAETHRRERDGQYRVEDLNDLVDSLTQYYRDQGYILARVIVPQQRIQDATLSLRLVIGHLQAVTASGQEHYNSTILARPFRDQVEQPVRQQTLQQALLRLSDYPGISMRTSLSPGTEPGTTRLDIDVIDEQPLSGRIELDNYGNKDTGPYRVTLAGLYNNPTNHADQLSGHARFSLFPANSVSGQLLYRVPLDSFDAGPEVVRRDTDLSLGYTASAFSLGGDLEILDIEGGSQTLSLRLDRDLARERDSRFNTFMALNRTSSGSDQNDASLGNDELAVLEAGAHWQMSDDWLGGGFTDLTGSISQGIGDFLGSMAGEGSADSSRQGSSGDYAGGQFTVVRVDGLRVQRIGQQFASIQLSAQYSPDLLTSLEQFSFGGPETVRGYPPGDRTADSGWNLRLEYYGLSQAPRLTLPVDQMKLAVFWDLAEGVLNDARPNEEQYPAAMGAGVYSQFVLADHYRTRLDLGVPLGSQPPSDNRRFSITFAISRTF